MINGFYQDMKALSCTLWETIIQNPVIYLLTTSAANFRYCSQS